MKMDSSEEVDLRTEGDLNSSSSREQWQAEHLGAATRDLLAADARVFLHQSLSTPCLNAIEGTEGRCLHDLDGRELLDFHGNYLHQVGYGHPAVVEAIRRQMNSLSFCPRRYTNRPAVALAERLTELAPGRLDRLLFAPGGALAVGMALKIARMATGRFKTLSMWDSFHGASLDAISVGGEAIFRNGIGPLLPGAEHAPPPNPMECPWDCRATGACRLKCAEYVAYMLEKEGDVAAVIGETVRAAPHIPPADYWKIIREACDRHGTLLILDEIPHALGRTGKMYTCEHFGVEPDLLVIGKGLGGGIFPLAAVLAREDLNDAVKDRAIGHYTHEKNPVACAAGLATLEVIEREGLLAHAEVMGRRLLAGLESLVEKHPIVSGARGLGLLCGLELRDPETGEKAGEAAERTMYRAMERGLSFKISGGNTLTLTPALTITEEEIDRALEVLDASLSEQRAP